MAQRKLFNEKTKALEDVDDSLVGKYISDGGYRFEEGDKVPVESGGNEYLLLDHDEAYNYVRTGNARYMPFEEYEKKRDEADFTDFGGDMAALALGTIEGLYTPAASIALGVGGDYAADALNKWFDLELGSASDYIMKSADLNPWWYYGSGVAANVAVAGILGVGAGATAGPAGAAVGGVAGVATGVGKAAGQVAVKQAAGAAARAAGKARVAELFSAIGGFLKWGADKTPVAWTMKMSNISRNKLAKTLSDGKVNAALHKVNPGLAAMFKHTDTAGQLALPGLAEAGKYAFATTATAGMVNAAAENGLFWGPMTAAKELILSNEERTLEEASEFILEQMGYNAVFGMAFSGVLDVGMKGTVWGAGKSLDVAGKGYHWMGENAIGKKVNDWWRSGAKGVSSMDAEGQANLDYAFAAGKEGYEHRQSILYMKEWYGRTVDRFKKTTNMLWTVQDFVEQVDIGASYSPEFVNSTLKDGIASGQISGDFIPAASDAVDTLGILSVKFDAMLKTLSLSDKAPDADPRILNSFRELVDNARQNIGRRVVEESRTVVESSEADELLVQEARDWFLNNGDRLRESFIDQYGHLFEDPNAMVQTTAGRRPKWFNEDMAEDVGEEGLVGSARGGVLDEEAALASSDYIDRTGLRIVEETDEMVLSQHPDYDPSTGKVLVPHEERQRLWSHILGIRPLKEALDVNVNGQRFTYVHKLKRWMDSRNNYLQTDPKKYDWEEAPLPAHRAPFDQNFIDIGGQVTQNPVQYEHYINKKTGKAVRGHYASREAFEDVQDKRPRHYTTPPPHLSDTNRHHYSQRLKATEDELASLQSASKVVDEQIEALKSGAPVPMAPDGRFTHWRGVPQFESLAGSGKAADALRALDDDVDFANEALATFLRENPVAQAGSSKGLPRDEAKAASDAAISARAKRFEELGKRVHSLREIQRKRSDAQADVGSDLQKVLEIHDPRVSEDLTEEILVDHFLKSGKLLDGAQKDVVGQLNKISPDIINAQDENFLVSEAIFDWTDNLSARLHEGGDHLEVAGGDLIRMPVDQVVKRRGLAEASAESVRKIGDDLIADMNNHMDSFSGKKLLIKRIRNHTDKIASHIEAHANDLGDAVSVSNAMSKSPAAIQKSLDILTKRKQSIRGEIAVKQKDAASFEGHLEGIPSKAPEGKGHTAAAALSERLSSGRLKVDEADRAAQAHRQAAGILYQEIDAIEETMNSLADASGEVSRKSPRGKEILGLYRHQEGLLKSANKRLRKLTNRKYWKEERRLDQDLFNAQNELYASEKAANPIKVTRTEVEQAQFNVDMMSAENEKSEMLFEKASRKILHDSSLSPRQKKAAIRRAEKLPEHKQWYSRKDQNDAVAELGAAKKRLRELEPPPAALVDADPGDGGVMRPSAAYLSKISGEMVTGGEKAALAEMQKYGYKGGLETGFEGVGKKKTYGERKGDYTYDDDLVNLLEHIRKTHEKEHLPVKAGPGYVSGREIADELGPDPTRGELGAPIADRLTGDIPERTPFSLTDKDGRLVVQGKGLGQLSQKFGLEGQPIEVHVMPQSPPPVPLEKFDELLEAAIGTGDGTGLEDLMRAMGFFSSSTRVVKEGSQVPSSAVDIRQHGILSYDEFWGFKPKPAERIMPTEGRSSVRDIKSAIGRVKNPNKKVVGVESTLIKNIKIAMAEHRATENVSDHGEALAGRLLEEDAILEGAVNIARSSGDISQIMEIAGRYGVQVQSSEMLADLFHSMHKLKNELHYAHSHEHVGKAGSDSFEDAANLVEAFLMGKSPRPAQGAYPENRNHFGNNEGGKGMPSVIREYKQKQAKVSQLRKDLIEQIGQRDPDQPSAEAYRSSEAKIRKMLLGINKDNVSYEMETIRSYLNNNQELLNDIRIMFDSGKFDIRNTRKMNEAFKAAGLKETTSSSQVFERIREFVQSGRTEMNGLNAEMSSRKFKAQIELGVKSGQSNSWTSSLGPLAGLSFGAFLGHPAAAAAVAATGVSMMNPRSTAIRLAQMERMATNFHQKVKSKTDSFVYETVSGKGPKEYRQTITRALIGPSAPVRNQGALDEYQREASKREIESSEFLRTRSFITDLVHNERAMAELVDRALPPGIGDYAPTIRAHMQDRLRIKIMAAYESMPKTFASEFMSADTLPSTMEMSKWARDLQAIQDPLGTLIEGLSSETLTKAEVKIIQATAPALYKEVVQRVVAGFSDPMIQARIPYKMKVQLTTLLGIRFTKPSTVRALQNAFKKEEQKKDQQRFERVMQSTQQSAGSTIDTVERSQ